MENKKCLLCGFAVLSSIIGSSLAAGISINAAEVEAITLSDIDSDILSYSSDQSIESGNLAVSQTALYTLDSASNYSHSDNSDSIIEGSNILNRSYEDDKLQDIPITESIDQFQFDSKEDELEKDEEPSKEDDELIKAGFTTYPVEEQKAISSSLELKNEIYTSSNLPQDTIVLEITNFSSTETLELEAEPEASYEDPSVASIADEASTLPCGDQIYTLVDNAGNIRGTYSTTTNGWKELYNNDWVYIENNQLVTNSDKLINGFYYHFDNLGLMARNYLNRLYSSTTTYDNIYYHNNSGRSIKGWYQDEFNSWYYFGSDFNAVRGVNTINGAVYSFADNGIMQQQMVVFDKDGTVYQLQASGKGTLQNPAPGFYLDKYYIGADNKACSGWKKINGNWYYFYPSSFEMAASSLLLPYYRTTIGNKSYYFNYDGVMQTGWILDELYANPSGDLVENGWRKIDNNWYYFKNFSKQSGFVQDGNTLYFISSDGGHYKAVTQQNGWVCVNNDWGYLENGEHLKNIYGKAINGRIYGFDSSGLMVTNTPYGYYYFDSNGYAKTNYWYEKLPGVWVYFDETGKQIDNGWKTIKNKKYYFISGEMCTEATVIDNQFCQFSKDGALINTPTTLNSGWNLVGGHWYYFKNSNLYCDGETEINGKTYYFQSNGTMVSGDTIAHYDSATESLYYYYYGPDGSWVKNAWCGVNNEMYADANGILKRGRARINGIDYLFDFNTRYLSKNVSVLTDDQSEVMITDATGRIIQTLSAKNKTGWIKSSSGQWFFAKNNKFQRGLIEDQGKLYYCSTQNGVMAANEIILSAANRYYIASSSGALSSHGWNGNQYVSNPGVAPWGITVINGKPYLFETQIPRYGGGVWMVAKQFSQGGIVKQCDDSYLFVDGNGNSRFVNPNQWLYSNGNWYYYRTSSMKDDFTHIRKINGVYYYLNDYGKMMTNTLYTELRAVYGPHSRLYYFNQNGNMKKGWQLIDNIWYYFGEDYQAVTGQRTIDGKTYYFNSLGQMIG